MPIALLTILVIIMDQWSKHYIQDNMVIGMSIPIIPDIFHLTYILNAGAAFGILENQRYLLIVVAAAMIGAVAFFYRQLALQPLLLRLGVGLLAGGAIGNGIDRINTGQVIDFFDFRIWPIFNVADVAIVTGVGCIIYTLIFIPETKDETN